MGTRQSSGLPRGIRQHPSSGFIVDVTLNGKRVTKTAKTLAEAVVLQEQLKKGKSLAKIKDEKPWTLQEAYEKAYALRWRSARSTSSERGARDFVAFVGKDTLVSEVTLDTIDNFISHLKGKGNSDGTVNRELVSVSAMLTVAQERKQFTRDFKIPYFKMPPSRMRFLSLEEEVKIFDCVRNTLNRPQYADFFTVLLYTGFRLSEGLNLKKEDVNLEKGTLTLWETKGGKPRTVPIVNKIRPIIEKYYAYALSTSNNLLFEGVKITTADKIWAKAKKCLGLSDDKQLVIHSLRHTCATRLVQAGVPITVVKAWLGHANIQTTMRYAHFAPNDLAEAAKLLGD